MRGAPALRPSILPHARRVYEPAALPPYANGVGITLTVVTVGDSITCNFTYGDPEGDPAGTHEYQWFSAKAVTGETKGVPDDILGQAEIAGATSNVLSVTSPMEGLHLACRVTPVSSIAPTHGSPVFSWWTEKVLPLVGNAPTASSVAIDDTTPEVNDVLTGTYVYSDLESDPEATSPSTGQPASLYRWLRDGTTAIDGATLGAYTVLPADIGYTLMFEVTPVAATGNPSTGIAYQSAETTAVPDPGSGVITETQISITLGQGDGTTHTLEMSPLPTRGMPVTYTVANAPAGSFQSVLELVFDLVVGEGGRDFYRCMLHNIGPIRTDTAHVYLQFTDIDLTIPSTMTVFRNEFNGATEGATSGGMTTWKLVGNPDDVPYRPKAGVEQPSNATDFAIDGGTYVEWDFGILSNMETQRPVRWSTTIDTVLRGMFYLPPTGTDFATVTAWDYFRDTFFLANGEAIDNQSYPAGSELRRMGHYFWRASKWSGGDETLDLQALGPPTGYRNWWSWRSLNDGDAESRVSTNRYHPSLGFLANWHATAHQAGGSPGDNIESYRTGLELARYSAFRCRFNTTATSGAPLSGDAGRRHSIRKYEQTIGDFHGDFWWHPAYSHSWSREEAIYGYLADDQRMWQIAVSNTIHRYTYAFTPLGSSSAWYANVGNMMWRVIVAGGPVAPSGQGYTGIRYLHEWLRNCSDLYRLTGDTSYRDAENHVFEFGGGPLSGLVGYGPNASGPLHNESVYPNEHVEWPSWIRDHPNGSGAPWQDGRFYATVLRLLNDGCPSVLAKTQAIRDGILWYYRQSELSGGTFEGMFQRMTFGATVLSRGPHDIHAGGSGFSNGALQVCNQWIVCFYWAQLGMPAGAERTDLRALITELVGASCTRVSAMKWSNMAESVPPTSDMDYQVWQQNVHKTTGEWLDQGHMTGLIQDILAAEWDTDWWAFGQAPTMGAADSPFPAPDWTIGLTT